MTLHPGDVVIAQSLKKPRPHVVLEVINQFLVILGPITSSLRGKKLAYELRKRRSVHIDKRPNNGLRHKKGGYIKVACAKRFDKSQIFCFIGHLDKDQWNAVQSIYLFRKNQ